MAAGGFGFPGSGDGAKLRVPLPQPGIGAVSDTYFRAAAASFSPALLAGREALLEGTVLGLSRPINEKPAEQARARSGGRTEPGVPANRASDGPDAGTRSGAGNRALLGWGHIGASNERHSDGRKQQ